MIIVAMGVLFAAGYALAAWRRSAGHVGVAVLGVVLAAKILFGCRTDLEIAVLGCDWYIRNNGVILYAAVCGLFGCVQPLLKRPREAWAIGILAAVVAAHGVYMNAGPGLQGTSANANVADHRHHLRQSSPYSCGAAVCVVAASYLGVTVSEAEMAERCLTSRRGTSLLNIYRGMMLTVDRSLVRLEARRLGYREVAELGRISLVVSGNHAVCLVGMGTHVQVHDTMRDGPEEWDEEDVEDRCDSVFVTLTRMP